MRRAAKVDGNQEQIVAALRKLGASVQSLSSVGDGTPDLLIGIGGRNYLLEVKLPKGRLDDEQIRWHARWDGQVDVIRSVDDALTWLTAKRVQAWSGR